MNSVMSSGTGAETTRSPGRPDSDDIDETYDPTAVTVKVHGRATENLTVFSPQKNGASSWGREASQRDLKLQAHQVGGEFGGAALPGAEVIDL